VSSIPYFLANIKRVIFLGILDQLRNSQSSEPKSNPLECSEQLAGSPLTGELSIGISQRHASSFQHQKPSVSAGQKRKNSERLVFNQS
jgi:hypothetical protein